MILAVDGRLANTAQPAGAGRYCREVLRALPEVASDISLRVYLDGPACLDLPVSPHALRILPAGSFWTHRILSGALRRDTPDVFFSPVSQLPWRCPCPAVVSVLDLAAWSHPEFFPWRKRMRMRGQTRNAIRRANHFIAISESTARDLGERLAIESNRIAVAPLGVSMVRPDDTAFYLPTEMSADRPYILYLGQLQPRKNLVRLIEAFELLCRSEPDLPHQLVIAGPDGWQCGEIYRAIETSPVAHRIVRLGFVVEAALPSLLAGADVLALVSLWEGFGLPALEAMAVGTAVLASNQSSLPEVVGDAGVLVPPDDTGAMAEGLRQLTTDAAFRKACEARGRARAKEFSWARCATVIADVVRECAAR